MENKTEAIVTVCYHCGDNCPNEYIHIDEKFFCCEGCKLVYEILNENNLCSYYIFNENPGIKAVSLSNNRFSFLDNAEISSQLISFKSEKETHVTFHIPAMHCSSCIWLLENFRKVDEGVVQSQVNFLTKEVKIIFDERVTSLKKIVEKLTTIGYEPELHLGTLEKKQKKKINRSRIIRIGIAGFCFGNIMMLSFPEYFSSGNIVDEGLKKFFSILILTLSLPVFFYSASEFFVKSYQSLKHKTTTIDVPIAIGIAAIFFRSVYEILSGTGQGYFDSGSGLIFFMLVGRWFQDFTFDALSFERDYKSFFPIAVSVLSKGVEETKAVNELKAKEKILIRNNELVPVDASLISGNALIDYSFVTGEALPAQVRQGELIFAGGRQTGGAIELLVAKEVSQSHLTQLWNGSTEKRVISTFEKLVNAISKYFIVVTLFISATAAAYWWNSDKQKAINAFTTVLVIACPCALALSAPFTHGNILRILGKKKIYLRNRNVIENLADINTIVFDKTGTLTQAHTALIKFEGAPLTEYQQSCVYSLVQNSSHPLSRLLKSYLEKSKSLEVKNYKEETGNGISGVINGQPLKLGSAAWLQLNNLSEGKNQTKVHISFNNVYAGYFSFENSYRTGIDVLAKLCKTNHIKTAVLSGDNNSEKDNLKEIFGKETELRFNQSPADKLGFVKILQEKNLKVMMVGDGLNDAGALQQSNVGIAVADNTNNFTPAADVIIDAAQLKNIFNLVLYAKAAYHIIVWSFIISLLYNFVGLWFAVTGTLSPLIAAILMPISTVSLVLFTVVASTVVGRKYFNEKKQVGK